MLRFLFAFLACLAIAGAYAQEKNVAEQGMDWLKGAWSNVQKQGKPAAERVIKQFPERFKQIPKNVSDLSKRVSKTIDGMDLDEKKTMLAELWRVRHCVNMMALIDSGLLETLTGIDTKMLKQMSFQIQQIAKRLSPPEKAGGG